jgi:hypothetical protein
MPTKKTDLERRVLQLEQRPTVFQLDPEISYVILLPDSTTSDEYESVCSAVSKCNNVFVIQADNIKFLEIS